MKKFKPAFTCRRASRYSKELVSVRLRNGMYAILKYVDGYWKLGSLKFRNKEKNEIPQKNNFCFFATIEVEVLSRLGFSSAFIGAFSPVSLGTLSAS